MIRTLIVDDDFRVADIHAAYMAKVAGFEVVGIAHTAATAHQAVSDLRPDLLLLDLYLPDEHGLSLLRRVREAPRTGGDHRLGHPPDAIVITAARDMASVRASMQLGAVSYLVKPFGFASLAARLGSYRLMCERTHSTAEADQTEVDAVFGMLRTAPTRSLPKGQSVPTMALVRQAVTGAGQDLSAAEVADQVGISRPTAQRYLAQLVQDGVVELHLRYGSTGRPEHRYRVIHSSAG
jgi:response regulator of citrate/malate metabolism